MNIYFDTCALNRLTDDQTQPRIRTEAQAVERILDLVTVGEVRWISSPFLRAEMQRNPNAARREVSLALLAFASEFVEPTESTYQRAASLANDGYGPFDALHLALAVQSHADFLLTVDDRFIARTARSPIGVPPSVANPVDWINRRAQWPLPPQSTR
ncbi:MAG: PIN domain-containing protein [Granulicella sp.]